METRQSRVFYTKPMALIYKSRVSLTCQVLSKFVGDRQNQKLHVCYVSGSHQKILNYKLQQWEGKRKKSLISDIRSDTVLLIALRNNDPKERKTFRSLPLSHRLQQIHFMGYH